MAKARIESMACLTEAKLQEVPVGFIQTKIVLTLMFIGDAFEYVSVEHDVACCNEGTGNDTTVQVNNCLMVNQIFRSPSLFVRW